MMLGAHGGPHPQAAGQHDPREHVGAEGEQIQMADASQL